MNKVFLIGNLTRDPEMRSTQSGVPVCNFSIAVNRRFRNAQTGQQETPGASSLSSAAAI